MAISKATEAKRNRIFEEKFYALHKNLSLMSAYTRANADIEVRCNIHALHFTTTPKRLINRGQGCPECGAQKAKIGISKSHRNASYERVKLRLSKEFPNLKIVSTLEDYIASKEHRIKLSCLCCDSEWSQTANVLMNYKMKYGCATCAAKDTGMRSRIPLSKLLAAVDYVHDRKILVHSTDGVVGDFECTTCGHFWNTKIRLVAGGSGCKHCTYAGRDITNHKSRYTVVLNGQMFTVQGYEPQAIRWIMNNTSITEDRICVERKLIPHFSYTIKGKDKKYYPDILINGSLPTIVEVKSTLTAGLHKPSKFYDNPSLDTLKAKANAVEKEGFKFVLMLMQGEARISMPKNWRSLSATKIIQHLQSSGYSIPTR